jgi:hypothetical protein
VSIVLQYQLLKIKERLLVRCLLPDLYKGPPIVLSFYTLAIITYLIVDDVLYYKHLLEESGGQYLFLYCEFDFEPFRMRFSPDEGGIHQVDLR